VAASWRKARDFLPLNRSKGKSFVLQISQNALANNAHALSYSVEDANALFSDAKVHRHRVWMCAFDDFAR
jgi:hypothetical protein